MLNTRNQLLLEDRIKKVQEGLIGFLYNEVVDEDGEYFDNEEPLPPPDDYISPDEKFHMDMLRKIVVGHSIYL